MFTTRLVLWTCFLLILALFVPLLSWALGNPPSPACLVPQSNAEPSVKLMGTVAMDIINVNPGGTGEADVVLRLERSERQSDTYWFRVHHNTIFGDTTLLSHQIQLCELLTNYPSLRTAIRAAFSLPPTGEFVFTNNGIREAEIDVNPNLLGVPGTARPMTMFNVVIFAK